MPVSHMDSGSRTDVLEGGEGWQADWVNASGAGGLVLSGMCLLSPFYLLLFILFVTEPPLAGLSHYVNQERVLQDTMVGADPNSLSIQDSDGIGFGGMCFLIVSVLIIIIHSFCYRTAAGRTFSLREPGTHFAGYHGWSCPRDTFYSKWYGFWWYVFGNSCL